MNRRASTSLGSELNVDDLSRTPKLPLRPHTTDDSAFLEDDLQLGKDKERPQQPTLEDLGILAAADAGQELLIVLLRKTLQGRIELTFCGLYVYVTARALRERSQVHAWMDSESLDDSPVRISSCLHMT